jgi:hypothetical protein
MKRKYRTGGNKGRSGRKEPDLSWTVMVSVSAVLLLLGRLL